jgi:hypothetical protein
MRNPVSSLGAIALAAGLLLGVASPAQSRVILSVSSGSTTFACDSSLTVTVSNCAASNFTIQTALGVTTGMTFSGTLDGFTVGMTVGLSNLPGDPNGAYLTGSDTFVQRTDTGQAALTIDLRALGFSEPSNANKTLFGASSFSANVPWQAGDSVFGQFATSASNDVAPALSHSPGNGYTNCTVTAAAGATSGRCDAPTVLWNDPGAPFSMRNLQTYNLSSGAKATFTHSATVQQVPEPMTLSLVGAALLGAAVVSRRRNKSA